MRTPTQAMFWQIWHGWRWGLFGGMAYMLVAAAVARVLPGYLRSTPGGEYFLPNAAAQLALPCSFLVIHLAAAFSLTGGDLKERGYWRTMFVLPVQTRTLVVWPMLWGSLALAGIWLFVALFIVRPMGHRVPLVWPITAAAAGLTMLQALSWMPLEQTWLRIVIATPPAVVIAVGAAIVAIFEVPEAMATAAFLAIVPLNYAAALQGVAAARRGDVINWQFWNRIVSWIATWQKPAAHPFRSPAWAQFWFECRSFAWLLPLCSAMTVAVMVLIAIFGGRGNVELPWKVLPMLLFMPVLMATLMGPQVGGIATTFLATRPASTVALVRSKFQMALASAIAAYVPVFLAVLLLLLARPDFLASVVEIARVAGPLKTAGAVLLVVVAPVLLTWIAIGMNLWLGLLGREWLVNAMAFAMAGLVGVSVLVGIWLIFHPELKALLWSLLPWFAGLLVILKMIVAAAVLVALRRSNLVRPATLGWMAAGWLTVVTGLCAIVLWKLPAGTVPASTVLTGIVLLVPFARLAGAPLALDWNRHR